MHLLCAINLLRGAKNILQERTNGVARILFGGGATRPMSPSTFYVISRSRPDWVGGGGVVADMFRRDRDLRKPTRFGGGIHVRWGGGGSGIIFFPVAPGIEQSESGKKLPFQIQFKERNNINSFQKKNYF